MGFQSKVACWGFWNSMFCPLSGLHVLLKTVRLLAGHCGLCALFSVIVKSNAIVHSVVNTIQLVLAPVQNSLCILPDEYQYEQYLVTNRDDSLINYFLPKLLKSVCLRILLRFWYKQSLNGKGQCYLLALNRLHIEINVP